MAVAAPQPPRHGEPITVTSETFREGDPLPRETAFEACGGRNLSPQLAWRGFPADTKSFAVTLFDPDAPTGCGFWHWLVWNIPSSVTTLAAGAGASERPAGGVSGRTDYGIAHYGGPCPPAGDPAHRYIFTVYALDVESVDGVNADTAGAALIFHLRGHVLATGSLSGRFAA